MGMSPNCNYVKALVEERKLQIEHFKKFHYKENGLSLEDAFAEYCKKLRGFSYWNRNTKSDLTVEKVLSPKEKEIKEELKTGGDCSGGQGFL